MKRVSTLMMLLTTGCAATVSQPVVYGAPAQRSSSKAPSPNALLESLGLAGVQHHIQQHPDTECRAEWRPESLAWNAQWMTPTVTRVLATARALEGTPYVYGGTSNAGFDCSGFVNKVYAAHGYDLPRTSREQWRVGLRISRERVRRGDLLFFYESPGGSRIGHVGMYAGSGKFIHAVKGRGRVSFDRIDSVYYKDRFAGARRIVALPPGRYTTRMGTARRDMVFESVDEIGSRWQGGPGPCLETTYNVAAARR